MAVNPGGYGAATRYGQSSVEQFKSAFFDRDAILKAMDKVTAKALSKYGAFVRQRARTSLRYREDPAPPGQPPSVHKTMTRNKTNKRTGVTKKQDSSPLRDFIFFAFEKATQSVVIGPAKTNQQNAFGTDRPIPAVLEYGGRVGIREHLHTWRDGRQEWVRTDLRFRLSGQSWRSAVGKPTRVRMATYAPRPYMHPAAQAELPNLMKFFRQEGF